MRATWGHAWDAGHNRQQTTDPESEADFARRTGLRLYTSAHDPEPDTLSDPDFAVRLAGKLRGFVRAEGPDAIRSR